MKLAAQILFILSSLGITYFAVDNLLSLGNWGNYIFGELNILIVAFLVSFPPVIGCIYGYWWISNAKSTEGYIIKLLVSSALTWAWLYIGSIYLALLRFQ